MKQTIEITFVLEGFHNWSNCTIPNVKFLKDKHRHIFHFTLVKSVQHLDRDTEFILFRREVLDYLMGKYGVFKQAKNPNFRNRMSESFEYFQSFQYCDFNSLSCEMISQELATEFLCSKVRTSEDEENSGTIEFSDEELREIVKSKKKRLLSEV